MEQISIMDKKTFIRGVAPANKAITESSNKLDNVRKRNFQPTRKKDLDKNGKMLQYHGRTGQRNVRTREKVDGQVNSQNWEAGSIHKSGSKTHRSIIPNPLVYPDYRQNLRNNRRDQQLSNYGRRPKLCKEFSTEHYLQANCQFVVASGNDYSMYENDPDKLVEWDLVEEVWLHCIESPNCPICLYPPVAAKITNCGHIFCYSCILHYLALSDDTCRQCPICNKYLVQKDKLKSMLAIQSKDYNIGEDIEMVLMKRNRDSLVPTPAYPPLIATIHPYSSLEDGQSNMKLIIATAEEVDKIIIGRELKELELLKEREGNQPEGCFIDEALNLLEARKQKVLENLSLVVANQFKGLSLCEGAMALPVACYNQELRNGPKQTFYFYQTKMGSHVFLNSLNVQMLTKEFGSLEYCPETIKGTIIEKETISMTSDFRQRFRYLKHLPLCCSFDIMELRITDPVFSPVTICDFKEQIEFRKKKRQMKEQEIRKIDRRVKIEEDKMFGRSRQWVDVHLESRTQFPDFSQEPSIVTEELVVQEVIELPSDLKWKEQSFAQMAKKAVPGPTWPSLPGVTVPPSSENDEDNSYRVPSYNTTFLQAMMDCTNRDSFRQTGEKKKSKKRNKILLLSTGGQRN